MELMAFDGALGFTQAELCTIVSIVDGRPFGNNVRGHDPRCYAIQSDPDAPFVARWGCELHRGSILRAESLLDAG